MLSHAVYALGVCLYRMLTGVLPFTGTTVKEILAAHVNSELVLPSRQRQQLGTVYDDLLKKLLVKSKGYRPSAGEAADILEDLADDIEEREKGVRRVRRRKKRAVTKKTKAVNPAVLATFAVVGVVVVIGAMLMGGKKPVTPATAGSGSPAAATTNATVAKPASPKRERSQPLPAAASTACPAASPSIPSMKL